MANHQLSMNTIRLALFGPKIRFTNHETEISFGGFTTGWLKFVKRLNVLGFSTVVSMNGGYAKVITNAGVETVKVLARICRSKTPFLFLALIMVPLVALAVFHPEIKPVKKVSKKMEVIAVDHCATKLISEWLETGVGDSSATLLESNSIGGVTSGLVECEGKRYSYTLELSEPKRVLKLDRLDS